MFTDLKIPADQRPKTPGEARTVAVVGTVLTVLLIAGILQEFQLENLAVLFLILFWIPMLVVHELGHALMARALGWRVREIVIGFGQELWHWNIGETHIRVKLAPVEGYVLPAPTGRDSLRLKSALIYAAGPGAELLILLALLAAFGMDTVFGGGGTLFEIAIQSLAIVILLGAGFNLLPFRVGNGVSDGLGILSSPFMPESAIELRLMTFELQEIGRLLDKGDTAAALRGVESLLAQYQDNKSLLHMHIEVLSADGRTDAARERLREQLRQESADQNAELHWLPLQAQVELDAIEPDYLTLDLALQKSMAKMPKSAGLMILKGASLVRRGRYEDGGRWLADAWRGNDGSGDPATMLAWLTIAAKGCHQHEAAAHYREAFDYTNRSALLEQLLERHSA